MSFFKKSKKEVSGKYKPIGFIDELADLMDKYGLNSISGGNCHAFIGTVAGDSESEFELQADTTDELRGRY